MRALVFALLLAQANAWAHLLPPERMVVRMDSGSQALMLFVSPQAGSFAAFDSDADGSLSAAELEARRPALERFIDARLSLSYAGAELRQSFSDIVLSADPDHAQVTIIRRYVAERPIPGVSLSYSLFPASNITSITALIRNAEQNFSENLLLQPGAATHSVSWGLGD